MTHIRWAERVRWFAVEHFEQLLVGLLFASIAGIHVFVDYKIAFLSFYYLPVIVAGFFIGRRGATYAALLVVVAAAFLQTVVGLGGEPGWNLTIALTLFPWAGFLILAAYVSGGLADQRRARHEVLKRAYLSALELLTLHLEAAGEQAPGHGSRVAAHSVGIARALGMRPDQIDAIRVAALFHELRPGDPHLAGLLEQIPGSAAGATLATSMRNAVALLTEYSHYFELVGSEWPADQLRMTLGAKVLAVADTFETLQVPTEARRPLSVWAALEEIERGAGTTFATSAVRALRRSVTPQRTLRMKALAV